MAFVGMSRAVCARWSVTLAVPAVALGIIEGFASWLKPLRPALGIWGASGIFALAAVFFGSAALPTRAQRQSERTTVLLASAGIAAGVAVLAWLMLDFFMGTLI